MKLLIIGLDGASYRVVHKYSKRFANLSELLGASKYGCLRSILPKGEKIPRTGPAWASLYTGVLPEEHGMTSGGWLIKHKSYVNLEKITVWELIQEKYTLGLMTMPITYPAFEVNGWMVSGFPAPTSLENCVFPPEVASCLDDEFAIDYCDGESPLVWRQNFDNEKQDTVEKKKVETLKRIYEHHLVDVVAVGLTLLDRYGHVYPQYRSKLMTKSYEYVLTKRSVKAAERFSKITGIYDRLFLKFSDDLLHAYDVADKLIGDLCDYFKPDNLVICSDHGQRKYGTHADCQHDMDGFYLVKGDSVSPCRKEMSVLDISPIVLNLLEIENRLGEPRNYEEFDSHKKRNKQADAEIERQLKGLGYI